MFFTVWHYSSVLVYLFMLSVSLPTSEKKTVICIAFCYRCEKEKWVSVVILIKIYPNKNIKSYNIRK